VIGRIAAGEPAAVGLESGQAMGISTGGAVPQGADVVIPIEYVVEHDNEVEVGNELESGSHVRPRGGDIRAGEVVVEPGSVLTPARLGALAAAGIPEVWCARRPRTAVLPTGTELRRPGEALGAGEIYEANGLILSAQLEAAGAVVERLPAVGDDEAAHRRALEQALGEDLVVTSGGVSVGPHDLVRRVEAELGVREVFWRVSVKPGKPIAFGVREETLVFGLPGNPVSTMVTFQLFVIPALDILNGAEPRSLPQLEATLAEPLKEKSGLAHFLPARLDWQASAPQVRALRWQGSGDISALTRANCFLVIPADRAEIPAGEKVSVLPRSDVL